MDKTSIKIIKREQAKASATPKLAVVSGEETEKGLRRKMADTVSLWIAARRENNRTKDTAEIRRILGGESLFNKVGEFSR